MSPRQIARSPYSYVEVGPLIYDEVEYEVLAFASRKGFVHEVRIKTDTLGAGHLFGAVGQKAEFRRDGRALPITVVSVEPQYASSSDPTDDRTTVVVYFAYVI